MKSEFRNWSDIRVFLAVVRGGSTLAASRALGVAQPTVARRIDVLEHELGLALFERDTRGFHPTEAGRALIPLAEGMEQAADQLTRQMAALAAVKPIRITAFSANFSPRVMDIFSDFSALHPEVEFEFLSSTNVLDLMAGEADIALRLSRAPVDDRLIQRKISTARFAVFGAQHYGALHGFPKSIEDLDGHVFATFSQNVGDTSLDRWFRENLAPEQIVLTVNNVELMHAAVRSGRALGVVNLRLAETMPELVQCFDPIDELSMQHMILTSPQAYRRAEVRSFLKFFGPRYAAIFN